MRHGVNQRGAYLKQESEKGPVSAQHCFPIASIHPDGRSDDPTTEKKSGDVANSFLKEWNGLSLYRMEKLILYLPNGDLELYSHSFQFF
jgi:hypothetical protein